MKELDFNSNTSVWKKDWDLSQPAFPGKHLVFLEDSFIIKQNIFLQLPEEVVKKICKAAKEIRDNETLVRLFWHCHFVLYHLNGYPIEAVREWPPVNYYSTLVADMFLVLVIISGIPKLECYYKKLGIPTHILVDTLDYIKLWMEDYHSINGRWGFSNFTWFVYHQQAGTLFRLGRLEYELSFFKGRVKAYLNQVNGNIIVFSESGVEFRGDGQVNGTNDIFDKKKNWISELIYKENTVIGNPIHPLGYALKEKTKIDINVWKLVLQRGDPVLDIHIPARGRLTPENVDESFNIAKTFYNEFFPCSPFKALYCGTWFLDSQLRQYLSSDSNITRFQERFYLYPTLTNDSSIFYWVFGAEPNDLSALPKKTHLQKAILSHYKAGNVLRTGYGFIVNDLLNKPTVTLFDKAF